MATHTAISRMGVFYTKKNSQQQFFLEHWYQIKSKDIALLLTGRTCKLSCSNIHDLNEYIRREKMWEKLRWYTYNITHIFVDNSLKEPNLISK